MLHATVAALVVVGEVLLLGKLAAYEHLVGGINILLRGEVVHDQDNTIPVEDPLRAHAVEGLDGQGPGDVIGQHCGYAALDDLAVLLHRRIGVGLQNFLCKRLGHRKLLSACEKAMSTHGGMRGAGTNARPSRRRVVYYIGQKPDQSCWQCSRGPSCSFLKRWLRAFT